MNGMCNGLCRRSDFHYETAPINGAGGWLLKKKWVKCRSCVIRIDYPGVFCPCCGSRISKRNRRSRNSKLLSVNKTPPILPVQI